MDAYRKAVEGFQEVTLRKVPQTENQKVDELARMASALDTWTEEELIVKAQFIAQIDQIGREDQDSSAD